MKKALDASIAQDRRARATALRLCYAAFFLSGAAGLVYEVSWVRQVGHLVGHTLPATAIVLASYFTGMAAGAWVAARYLPSKSLLCAYAAVEGFAALWACAVPWLLEYAKSAPPERWSSLMPMVSPWAAQCSISFILLLPATFALGATLPWMLDGLTLIGDRDVIASSPRTSIAYALNLAGALFGLLSATFVLLLYAGVRGSGYVAVVASLLSGLIALIADRVQQSRSVDANPALPITTSDEKEAPAHRALFAAAAISGFGVLALEVLYTRLFSLVFHNSSYTFGVVTASFLFCLAMGAWLAGRMLRHFAPLELIGWAASIGAFAIPVSVYLFALMTGFEYFSFGRSFPAYIAGAFAMALLIVAPPIVPLGMLLPLIWNANGDGHAGRTTGRLTALNTFAAAAGSLAASFFLLPSLGLEKAFFAVAALYLAIGVVAFRTRPWRLAVFALAAVIVVVQGRSISDESVRGREPVGERLVQRWSSPYGLIDVVRVDRTGSLKVRQNLHYRFGQTTEAERERRQGHLPLLLHPNPRSALFLGLGTGVTAGAVVLHREVERAVVVELIPEVVAAARLLKRANLGVVEHPKVEMQIDDARHFLLGGSDRFDVIVSDLFVPWESETGYLYTVEHYQAARRRLASDGLFCQWLPLYQLGIGEFEMIADSFANVYPHVTVWWGNTAAAQPILALVGACQPIEINEADVTERLSELWRQTGTVDESLRDATRLFDLYQGDWRQEASSVLNTDEHPRLEFLMPITKLNRRTMSGDTLLGYYDARLARLPTADVHSSTLSGGTEPNTAQRNAWRRVILSGGESEERQDEKGTNDSAVSK